MKSNSTTIIIITIVIAGGAYWFFSSKSGEQSPLTASSSSVSTSQMQFQTLVSKLRVISFDTSIFSDPRFTSLVDITTPIAAEPSGRLDPFAPVAGVTGQ